MNTRRVHTLVIGSGAAGLCAAVRLHALGVTDVLICSEGLRMGTSVNTGSDKQTYYKLGMYGAEQDSPALMARDLFAGGAVHGDLALVEAAVSQQAFAHLASLGVPFPHDEFGQFIGYKTDHDPKRRATSCGPYTSRDMCLRLIDAVKMRGIPVLEDRVVFALLTAQDGESKRCIGAAIVNRKAEKFSDCIEFIRAENVVFAAGGPGGLYARSVYPAVHTGGIGVALEAGAAACSLPESQFGLASLKFRWNVSGSYMQVLPRFISTDDEGGDEREFLREYFDDIRALEDAVFLKGYQWPFAAVHVPGSSLIDLMVYVETELRGRRVWLDYRTDPADLDIASLSQETREYLEKSGCTGRSPLGRLLQMNAPAAELYRTHGIDLAKEPLEIAVCAQHNNGGLAANLWWESENIRHLFPVGEVNGSHGVIRPGGSALNAGQVGAFRAAEYIAAQYADPDGSFDAPFNAAAQKMEEEILEKAGRGTFFDWKEQRAIMQARMSRSGAFLREKDALKTALQETRDQLANLRGDGLASNSAAELSERLRTRSLVFAAAVYLAAMLEQVETGVGSRGGSVVLTPDGRLVHDKLPFKIADEDRSFRASVQVVTAAPDGSTEIRRVPCRPIPETDGWFETVWKACREKKIYDTGD
ncbi:MAG: FAD-binding protein [Lentisphaeria bacterium]|nr:FAD-binding protein [Lentisphaeria bacterium]